MRPHHPTTTTVTARTLTPPIAAVAAAATATAPASLRRSGDSGRCCCCCSSPPGAYSPTAAPAARHATWALPLPHLTSSPHQPPLRPSSPTASSSHFHLLLHRPLPSPPHQASRRRTARGRSAVADAKVPPERSRPGGRAPLVPPTAPHLSQPFPSATDSPSADAPHQLRAPPRARQPDDPAPPSLTCAHRRQDPPSTALPTQSSRLSSPSRGPAIKTSPLSSHRPLRLPAARLWNPLNSTPRTSTPPTAPVALQHPTLANASSDSLTSTGGSYPLLTLAEQRQSKHNSAALSGSLLVERAATTTGDHCVSLPKSVRASYEGATTTSNHPTADPPEIDAHAHQHFARPPSKSTTIAATALHGLRRKGKAIMASDTREHEAAFATDLERGTDAAETRPSTASAGDAIRSALSSNSSIVGDDVQQDGSGGGGGGEAWGPQHPCYPHLNPHVPVDSLEYATTRIIRIRRDWLLHGDLAPTFSNLYPEILDPAGVSEHEFRRVIAKLNGDIVPTFSPFAPRNILDGLLGLLTGWLWDDLGMTAAKARLNHLDAWIDRWNVDMEKAAAPGEGILPPKMISLRQTGYMTLDVQIPDPKIAPAPSSTGANDSRTALPLEPAPAVTAS